MGPQGERGLDGANGRDGRDGADGLSCDTIALEREGRTRRVVMRQGDRRVVVGEWTEDMMLYRGVWTEDTTYEPGDTVTHQGSGWVALETTTARPDEFSPEGARSWQLAVKRGREGKQGPRGPQGEPGQNGRDLTQMDTTGRKW